MNGFPSIYSSANIKRNYVPGVPCSHALDTKLKMIKNPFFRGISQLAMEDKDKNGSW